MHTIVFYTDYNLGGYYAHITDELYLYLWREKGKKIATLLDRKIGKLLSFKSIESASSWWDAIQAVFPLVNFEGWVLDLPVSALIQ